MVEACPPATGDITLNLRNRGKAIRKANYGPMDPNHLNGRYWEQKAQACDVTPEEAKTQRCGNCAAFDQTSKMIKCIEDGIAGKDGMKTDAMEVIDAGDLGFCEIFDFKCAAKRTCDAWIVGGPITDEDAGGDGEMDDGSVEMDDAEDMSEDESYMK